MQITRKVNDVELNNIGQGDAYGIEDSAMAAFVLSSNIYSHHRRAEAVLRELSTNAQDAMEKAGRGKTPISVHLPTAFEPFLIIEDSGVGLTAQEVKTLIGIYFRSESSKNPHANGYFGVGSKSPFAYTSMFTVEAFKDGMRCLYQCYKNAEDEPHLTLLVSEPTTHANGFIANIPVEVDDVELFSEAALLLYQHFNCIPKFVGLDLTSEIKKRKKRVKKLIKHAQVGWKYFEIDDHFEEYYNNEDGNSVVMGSVSYPLDLEILCASKWSTLGSIDLSWINGLVLELDISVDPINLDTGREKLQYSELTCTVLSQKIQRVISYAKDYFDKHSKGLSEWETRCVINDELNGDVILSLATEKGESRKLTFDNYRGKFNAEIKLLSLDGKSLALRTDKFSHEVKGASGNNVFSAITPTKRLIVMVKTDRSLNREVISGHLNRINKNILIIESNGGRPISMDQAQPILEWLGNPEVLTADIILADAQRAKEELKLSIRNAAIAPAVEKIRQTALSSYNYSSTTSTSRPEVEERLQCAEKQGEKVYYFSQPVYEQYAAPSHETVYMALSLGLVDAPVSRRSGMHLVDILCIPQRTLDLLNNYTCLTNIDEELRGITSNKSHPLFDKAVTAIANYRTGKGAELSSLKLQKTARLLSMVGDLLAQPQWQLNVLTRLRKLEHRLEKNASLEGSKIDADDWVKYTWANAAASEKIQRLISRHSKAIKALQPHPILNLIDENLLHPAHAQHKQTKEVLRNYVSPDNASNTRLGDKSTTLRVVK
jgi:hypothetical protein